MSCQIGSAHSSIQQHTDFLQQCLSIRLIHGPEEFIVAIQTDQQQHECAVTVLWKTGKIIERRQFRGCRKTFDRIMDLG